MSLTPALTCALLTQTLNPKCLLYCIAGRRPRGGAPEAQAGAGDREVGLKKGHFKRFIVCRWQCDEDIFNSVFVPKISVFRQVTHN